MEQTNSFQVQLGGVQACMKRLENLEALIAEELKQISTVVYETTHVKLGCNLDDMKQQLSSLQNFYLAVNNSKIPVGSTTSGYFSLLAPEIMLHIFSFMSPPMLLTCSKVNWEFKKYCEEDALWKLLSKKSHYEPFWNSSTLAPEHNEPLHWRDVFRWFYECHKKAVFPELVEGETTSKFTRGFELFPDGSIYKGEWKNHTKHGKGIQIWLEGDVYKGYWKDGKRSGYGLHVWPDGHLYEGFYEDDKRHGPGIFKWPDKREYRGNYRQDHRNGHGEFIWPNGDRYCGNYENSNRNGMGTFYWVDGKKYEGIWKEGNYHGYGVYTHRDGCVYKGQWKDNYRHGQGEFHWPDGDYYQGEWTEGRRTGSGKFHKWNGNSNSFDIVDQFWTEEKWSKHDKGLDDLYFSGTNKKRAKPEDESDSDDRSPGKKLREK